MTPAQRIDWPRVIDNLRRLGMTQRAIADELGIQRERLHNWAGQDAQGEPAWWVGDACIALWVERTGMTRADLPTRRRIPSVSECLRE